MFRIRRKLKPRFFIFFLHFVFVPSLYTIPSTDPNNFYHLVYFPTYHLYQKSYSFLSYFIFTTVIGLMMGSAALFSLFFLMYTIASVVKLDVYNCVNNKTRSSRPEVFCEKAVLRNSAKFKGKHLCQILLFNKVAGAWNFIKKVTLAQVFSCEFC